MAFNKNEEWTLCHLWESFYYSLRKKRVVTNFNFDPFRSQSVFCKIPKYRKIQKLQKSRKILFDHLSPDLSREKQKLWNFWMFSRNFPRNKEFSHSSHPKRDPWTALCVPGRPGIPDLDLIRSEYSSQRLNLSLFQAKTL